MPGQPLNQPPPAAHHGFGKNKKRRRWEIAGLIVLVLVLLVGGRSCLGLAADLIARNLPYSVDAEIGELAADEFRKKYELAGDPTAEQVDRVETLFEDLQDGLQAEDKKVLSNARVTVVVDDTVNAFALPGGEVFVLTGLLDRLEGDDDQLRGVLAHELGHAIKRHGLRSLARRAAIGIVLSLMIGDDAFVGTLIEGAAQLDTLGHSRSMETEADEFGTDLLIRTGNDVEGLARFLESLGSQPVPELLSTHPDPADRADEIRIRAKQLK